MGVVTKKKYPQAAPYRAPEDLVSQCDQWRRRAYWLVAAIVVIVMLGLGSVAVVINRAKNQARQKDDEPISVVEPYVAIAPENVPPKPKAAPVMSIAPPT